MPVRAREVNPQPTVLTNSRREVLPQKFFILIKRGLVEGYRKLELSATWGLVQVNGFVEIEDEEAEPGHELVFGDLESGAEVVG